MNTAKLKENFIGGLMGGALLGGFVLGCWIMIMIFSWLSSQCTCYCYN